MTSISWAGFSPQCYIIIAVVVSVIYFSGFHWEAVTIFIVPLNLFLHASLFRTRISDNAYAIIKKKYFAVADKGGVENDMPEMLNRTS